jgi:hypothetical protein
MSGQNRPSKANWLVEATQVDCAVRPAALALTTARMEYSSTNTSIQCGSAAAAQPEAWDRSNVVATQPQFGRRIPSFQVNSSQRFELSTRRSVEGLPLNTDLSYV